MDAAPDRTRSTLRIAVLAGAGVMVSVMQTLVVPLVPQLPQLLHTSSANASWVVTVTLLTAAVVTPVFGRLGDMFGKRRMMLVSITGVAVGSLVCGLASSLPLMVLGRTLQGTGMGLIPLGISLMRDVVPANRLGTAVAVMSSSLGVGSALGVPAASALAQVFGWHAVFWVSFGLAAVVGVLIFALVPETDVRVHGRLDPAGMVGLSLGLVGYLLAVSKGAEWGWTSATTLGMFGLSTVAFLVWARWELRCASPMVDLRVSARRPVLATNLTGILIGLAMYAQNLLAPRLLQLPAETGYGLHMSLLRSAFWTMPSGLGMIVLSQVAGRLIAARGARLTLITGCIVCACAHLVAQVVIGNVFGVLLFNLTMSAGTAFALASMPSLIMDAVDETQTAAANALNSLSRSLGTSTASAIIGAVLGQLTTVVHGEVFPSLAGVRLTLLIGAASGLVAAAAATFLPRLRRTGVLLVGEGEADVAGCVAAGA